MVVAGNGTRDAMLALGLERCKVLDVTSRLNEAQAKAWALADNRVQELSQFDYPTLSEILRQLPQELREAAGFEAFELEPLLAAAWGGRLQVVKFGATDEEAQTIDAAIAKVREAEGAPDMAEGRALELIAADFMAGA